MWALILILFSAPPLLAQLSTQLETPVQTQDQPVVSVMEQSFYTPAYTFPKHLTLCGEQVPLEEPEVWEAFDQEFTIAVYNRGQVILWLKRGFRHFPQIEAELKSRGMPDDLKYLAVAESDLRTYAFSPAGAGGPWQFIRPTASRYGLRQGGFFDDRLCFDRATDAALTYLQDLYNDFGSWALAMAAYNCGEKRVEKEIQRQGENNYFRMNLPLETERYVHRILAIKTILSDPERYGFRLDESLRYQPREVDIVEVNIPSPLHMRTAAKACGTYLKALKELNPEIRGYYFPEGNYTIRIPKGSHENFVEFYADWSKNAPKQKDKTIHVVRKGDTLLKISRSYGVDVDSLKKWNGLRDSTIFPGQKLQVF